MSLTRSESSTVRYSSSSERSRDRGTDEARREAMEERRERRWSGWEIP